MSQKPDVLLIKPFDHIKCWSTCCFVCWEAVALFFILFRTRCDIRELEQWHCTSGTKFHGFTSFGTVHVVFALCRPGKVLRQESCSNFAGSYLPARCCIGMSWFHYDQILRHAERLCIILPPRIFLHVQYNVDRGNSSSRWPEWFRAAGQID